MSNSTISKSIRLPDYLVEFIEAQEGDNFSEKLLGILYDYRCGDTDRQMMLQSYRRDIARYKDLYSRLINEYGEARSIIVRMHKHLDDMKELADRAAKESAPDPEDPDLVPGVMPFT